MNTRQLFRLFLRNLKPVIWFAEFNDPFESDSDEGLKMFPGTGLNLLKIRIFLRLLIFRKAWTTFSLPIRIAVVMCGLATASGTVFLTQVMITSPEDPGNVQMEKEIHPNYEITWSDAIESDETTNDAFIENTKNNLRNPGHSEEISPIKTISYTSISLLPDTTNYIRYSSFRELYFHEFRFVDFRHLYGRNKPLLIPELSGTEARFEYRDDKPENKGFLMADTIGYVDFLEKLAFSLKNSNYAEGFRLVNLLTGQHPVDENGLFYKGYIYYCKKEYNLAMNYFLKCEHSGFRAFYHEARLYRANILLTTGKFKEALKLTESIELENNPYKTQVATLKTKILKNTIP